MGGGVGIQEQYESFIKGAHDVTGPSKKLEQYRLVPLSDENILAAYTGRWGYWQPGASWIEQFSFGPPGPPRRYNMLEESGEHLMLLNRPKDLHNAAIKTADPSQLEEMCIGTVTGDKCN
ncbi:MAG: hypothetical protein GY862_33460, partial [Gammaproteobacteria bacterium]|nr:hypothetical protein [Gammaproteobacteria bacterium]